MTKSKIEFKEKSDPNAFVPGNLFYNEYVRFVVMCTEPDARTAADSFPGVIVWSDGLQELGSYSDSWVKNAVVPFVGQIILES